jgi:fructose-1,6-bisphosphatase II / sedoheptulose-1,7-bisphosphatase
VLISDGDVAGVIWTTDPETGIDLYVGQGGASEGVLAAAALKCAGGQFQARFVARNDEERARLRAAGIADPDHRLALNDLVSGDAVFAASGVTDGLLLSGVRKRDRLLTTHTLVMNSATSLNAALFCKTQAP